MFFFSIVISGFSPMSQCVFFFKLEFFTFHSSCLLTSARLVIDSFGARNTNCKLVIWENNLGAKICCVNGRSPQCDSSIEYCLLSIAAILIVLFWWCTVCSGPWILANFSIRQYFMCRIFAIEWFGVARNMPTYHSPNSKIDCVTHHNVYYVV